jgi:hypothetical protein
MVELNKESLKIWQDLDREPIRYDYGVKAGELIIDIGSYQREWSNEMIKRYGCKTECFEALDNRAAWKFDGTIEVGGAYYYTSSLLPPTGSVQCVDIAPYLQQEIAVLKMNIEGGEYELLSYIIEKGLHKNIRNLQVQFHEVEGLSFQLLYDGLAVELSKTHKLSWRYPFCWENWERKDIC